MSFGSDSVQGKTLWTIGTYAASLAIRLGTNVVLSRMLAPDILGVMVVVHSVRYGVELLTDVGIEQNIIHNSRGATRPFLNTAWTLQIIRGGILSLVFLSMSPFLSNLFNISRDIFMVISLAPFINSLCSTSVFLLVRSLNVRARNLFELGAESLAFLISVTFVYITPTIWAPVLGVICALIVRSALSYLLPHPAHRLTLDARSTREILNFGKWIMVSSFTIYASTNIDKLYLGTSIPFQLLGIYGLARTISDLPPILATRLSYQIVFPMLAATEERGESVTGSLSATRWKFVLLASLSIGSAASWSDFAIKILYDARYHEAGWMLFGLLLAAWFAVISNLNEGTLLARGKPAYNSLSNTVRLLILAVGVPLSVANAGLVGCIAVIIASELCRYVVVLYGQSRFGLMYLRQDTISTMLLIATIAIWACLRSALSLGQPWQ
ncbi:hypothetical protein VQ03_09810 [Methylobacterium tarhaniae]|uniref:Polysaccharide biosynthesis protein n=1 Tax=Methylobacterium tarhaniae TaxID=1187852 RepID=A0A0J6TAJ2_9HYPH|nr:oligosaccharide flippase family protein [Methylobacterium tarhaniae]KMO42902.1 hypothetical protein VQ03_09810 [Methylobacterium tarhaniae]